MVLNSYYVLVTAALLQVSALPKPATDLNVTDYGLRGSSFQLLTASPIRLDGYLVRWEYFVAYTESPCDSYAAVWRPSGEAMYDRITSTRLTPNNPLTREIRSQATTEIVRVKKGDIISIYVDNRTQCNGNLVSFSDNAGTPWTVLTLIDMRFIDVKESLDLSNKLYPRRDNTARRVAIQVYVEEHVRLSSPPVASHSGLSSAGEIRLTWETLPSYDSVIGFLVLCYQQTKLSNSQLACNETFLGQVNQVILKNLDTKIPLQATVQVLRKINGLTASEELSSPISNTFCPETKLTSKDIIFNFTKERIEIKVPQLQADDVCTVSRRIRFINLTDNTEIIRNITTEDSLELDSGNIYKIFIIVTLIDGHEAVVYSDIISDNATGLVIGERNQQTSSAVLGVAVGVPVAVLIPSVIVVVVCIRRKSKTQSKTNQVKRKKEILMKSSENSSTGVYEEVVNEQDVDNSNISEARDSYLNVDEELSTTDIPAIKLYSIIQQEKLANPEDPFSDEFGSLESPEKSVKIGRDPANIKKNRFKNITAFDDNRVILKTDEVYKSDYVNASYIKDVMENKAYIACQAPNDNTLEDMWRLINDSGAKVVVMLTNPIESGKGKCSVYWPESPSHSVTFGRFTITLMEQTSYAEYVIRKLKFSIDKKSKVIKQFYFTEWDDHDVPTTAGLLSFRCRVKQEINKTKPAPTIIHCSAGVGRTGTFIGADIVIEEFISNLKKSKQPTVNIVKCVNTMREQRPLMVQTSQQYAFLYEIVCEAITSGNTLVECSRFINQMTAWMQPVKSKSGEKKTSLSDQFEKLAITSTNVSQSLYSESTGDTNKRKNRSKDILPLNRYRIVLLPDSNGDNIYVNAISCDSYFRRKGFIVTQTPLKAFVSDFWTMIFEQQPAVILYFNDCQKEATYWPAAEGESMNGEGHVITNSSVTNLTNGVAEVKLQCHKNENTLGVKHISVPVDDNGLPSCKQLLLLSALLEKFVSSEKDKVLIQCRDGCRLSGLFVVAMNLYLRARIEQEVDVVLEVKLARRHRPQFIPNLEMFEYLYSFVKEYLSEFDLYSNFSAKE